MRTLDGGRSRRSRKRSSRPTSGRLPYDELTNPLAINLTAFNTFVLICSSVTMVLALAAIQDGKRGRGNFFLGATVLIGSVFLSIQVYEYYQLMVGHHYPPGISATGHFRPERQPVCLVLLHDDRVSRGPRDRRRDPAVGHLHRTRSSSDAYIARPLRAGRAGRSVLALRRPGVDHPVHDRLPALI